MYLMACWFISLIRFIKTVAGQIWRRYRSTFSQYIAPPLALTTALCVRYFYVLVVVGITFMCILMCYFLTILVIFFAILILYWAKKNTCVSANPGAVLYTGDNEGISLKRPVVQRGSILLAELVAILMVLEQFQHCIAALKDGFTDIKILSDSQTAVGILTQLEVIKLHWHDLRH